MGTRLRVWQTPFSCFTKQAATQDGSPQMTNNHRHRSIGGSPDFDPPCHRAQQLRFMFDLEERPILQSDVTLGGFALSESASGTLGATESVSVGRDFRWKLVADMQHFPCFGQVSEFPLRVAASVV